MAHEVSMCSVFFPGGIMPLVPRSSTPANLLNGLSVYVKNIPESSVFPPKGKQTLFNLEIKIYFIR